MLLDLKLVYTKLVLVFYFFFNFIIISRSLNSIIQAIYGWGMALLPAADFASFKFVNISGFCFCFCFFNRYISTQLVVHICTNYREILIYFPTVSICGINFPVRCNEEKPENCLCTCVFTQQNLLICTRNYV